MLGFTDISDVLPESNIWDVSLLILWICEVIYKSAIASSNRNVSTIKCRELSFIMEVFQWKKSTDTHCQTKAYLQCKDGELRNVGK